MDERRIACIGQVADQFPHYAKFGMTRTDILLRLDEHRIPPSLETIEHDMGREVRLEVETMLVQGACRAQRERIDGTQWDGIIPNAGLLRRLVFGANA